MRCCGIWGKWLYVTRSEMGSGEVEVGRVGGTDGRQLGSFFRAILQTGHWNETDRASEIGRDRVKDGGDGVAEVREPRDGVRCRHARARSGPEIKEDGQLLCKQKWSWSSTVGREIYISIFTDSFASSKVEGDIVGGEW